MKLAINHDTGEVWNADTGQMILTQIAFIVGKPVVIIRQDTKSGQVGFSPNKPSSKPPQHNWQSADQP